MLFNSNFLFYTYMHIMNVEKFKVKKKRTDFYSIARILFIEDEITVDYTKKVSIIPRIPNKDSQVRFSETMDNEKNGYVSRYITGKMLAQAGLDKSLFGYSNTFKISEMDNVKLKYIPCFTWATIIDSVCFWGVVLFAFVLSIKFGPISYPFFYLLLLLFSSSFFLLWINTVQIIEITLKNRPKVLIPVYGYMFPIFNRKRKQEIYDVYERLKSLIR